MHLFESSIAIDASAQQCVNAWQECAIAWMANESFLDFKPLENLLNPDKVALERKLLDWEFATNSNKKQYALWWQHNNGIIDASGTIFFDELAQKPQHKTQITFKMTFHNALNGLDGFKLEANTGLAIQNALKQFKKIIQSNMALHRHPHPNNKPGKNSLEVLVSENFRKERLYATV